MLAVSEMGEIEQFFAEAVEWYRAQGIVATKPQVERIEALTDRLAAVSVRWPFVRRSRRGTGKRAQPRICVALTRTVTTH
ncbi:MAG TPA: hypothetical protein VJ206_04875 [bacterium]|nr:hypothetical protein [bacterium]